MTGTCHAHPAPSPWCAEAGGCGKGGRQQVLEEKVPGVSSLPGCPLHMHPPANSCHVQASALPIHEVCWYLSHLSNKLASQPLLGEWDGVWAFPGVWSHHTWSFETWARYQISLRPRGLPLLLLPLFPSPGKNLLLVPGGILFSISHPSGAPHKTPDADTPGHSSHGLNLIPTPQELFICVPPRPGTLGGQSVGSGLWGSKEDSVWQWGGSVRVEVRASWRRQHTQSLGGKTL